MNKLLIISGPTATGKTALAVEIASLPMQVRGYGHVKMRNVEKMTKQRDDLLAAYHAIKTDDVAQAVAAE